MSFRIQILGISAVAIAALWLGGCNNAPQGGQESSDDGMEMDGHMEDMHMDGDHMEDGHMEDGHMHDDHEGGGDDQAKIEENLNQLSEADRAVAEKQKICPVTEKPLGAMGKPIKIEVEDQQVFICCPACEDAVRENPDKYLAKISPEK